MLKQKIKIEWLMLGVFLAATFLLGVKGVYAYLDIISFTKGNYNVSSLENHSLCPDKANVNDSTGDQIDRCTGLRWKGADVGGVKTWAEANTACAGNYRLPTIDELFSLVDVKNRDSNGASPLINLDVNANISDARGLGAYWSATDLKDDTNTKTINESNYVRSVAFWQGTADNIVYSKSMALNVRCINKIFCGNGKREGGEECDGKDFGGYQNTCKGRGYVGGVLSCSQCQVNTSGCFRLVVKPTAAGQTCAEVCAQYKINSNGIVCNANSCTGTALTCKLIGTDLSASNNSWRQRVLSSTNTFECKNVKGHCGTDFSKPCLDDGDCGGAPGACTLPNNFNPPSAPCNQEMTGFGDACESRPTPWAYCQCG